MKTKGQVAGQIMIYILAGVIIVLVLLYGYKAIEDFGKKADTVSYIQFRKDLDTTVQSIASDVDSELERQFAMPKADEVCFVDHQVNLATFDVTHDVHIFPTSSGSGSQHQIIESSLISGGPNVFLFDKNVLAESPFRINYLSVPDDIDGAKYDVICYHSKSGHVNIRLIGNGNSAKLAVPNDWNHH